MRGWYWISTSRSSNMNCETSCKAGRCGASTGCAAGVRGCRCLAKSHLLPAGRRHDEPGSHRSAITTHGAVQPAIDKTENSMTVLGRNVQNENAGNPAGVSVLAFTGDPAQAPVKGRLG